MAPAHALGPLAPLAEYRQFIPVKLVPLASGKVDKLPIDHRTGSVTAKGSDGAHNPEIWLSYEHAALIASALGPSHGVGFVLTAADPFVVVDLDGALDAATGQWSDTARAIHAMLPGAVTEVSQSGRGLHFWLRSNNMPEHAKKNTALALECYSSLRFILLGSIPDAWPVQTMADDCPGMIHNVVVHYFPRRQSIVADVRDDGPCAEWRGPESDEALLEIAMRSRGAASVFGDGVSFAQLWEADAEALGRKWPAEGRAYDASSADMALAQRLAFFTGRDQGRVDRMMRASALARDKYERADYLPRTISAACAQQRDVYRGGEHAAVAPGAASTPADPGRWGIIKEDPLNAARALLHRRYSHADGMCLKAWQDGFYRWDASHWVEMTTPDARAQLYDFLDREGSADYRPNQAKVSNLLDALKAAAHLDSSHVAPCWISGPATAPPFDLVPCANGLLHLPSRSMLPATPRFFNMNAVPFAYEPSASQPAQWLHFLAQVWPNDPEAISTLQELFGYLLTPDTSQQKIFLIIGPKRSGKGTIARVLTEMLGIANVAGPSLASLAKDFGLQPLIGKQAAIISDARLGGQTDAKQVAENLLRVSGEDRVDVARKNTSSLSLRLGVRFVLLTNELPRIADASGAMASRFVILSMSESFLGREDPGLTAKLLPELPSILGWAVDGWHRLKSRGHFVEPKSSAGAAQELADLGSPIAAFVRDECQCSPHAEVETGHLFATWRNWCVLQGIQHSGTLQTFGRDLRAAFPSITQRRPRTAGDRVRVYQGIAPRGPKWSAVQPIAAPPAPTHQ